MTGQDKTDKFITDPDIIARIEEQMYAAGTMFRHYPERLDIRHLRAIVGSTDDERG